MASAGIRIEDEVDHDAESEELERDGKVILGILEGMQCPSDDGPGVLTTTGYAVGIVVVAFRTAEGELGSARLFTMILTAGPFGE